MCFWFFIEFLSKIPSENAYCYYVTITIFGLKGAKKWEFQICTFFIIHPILIEFLFFWQNDHLNKVINGT